MVYIEEVLNIIRIIINLGFLIFVYREVLKLKAPNKYNNYVNSYQYLEDNLKLYYDIDIIKGNETCNSSKEEIPFGNYPGIKNKIPYLHLTVFKGIKLCGIKGENHSYYLEESELKCKSEYQNCGILDSFNQNLCFPKNLSCPLNYFRFSNYPQTSIVKEYKTITIIPGKEYLHYSNQNSQGKIIALFNLSDYKDGPCAIFKESNIKYYFNEDFKKCSSGPKDSFINVGSINKTLLYQENNNLYNKLNDSGYEVSKMINDTLYLYVRNYYGKLSREKSKINSISSKITLIHSILKIIGLIGLILSLSVFSFFIFYFFRKGQLDLSYFISSLVDTRNECWMWFFCCIPFYMMMVLGSLSFFLFFRDGIIKGFQKMNIPLLIYNLFVFILCIILFNIYSNIFSVSFPSQEMIEFQNQINSNKSLYHYLLAFSGLFVVLGFAIIIIAKICSYKRYMKNNNANRLIDTDKSEPNSFPNNIDLTSNSTSSQIIDI